MKLLSILFAPLLISTHSGEISRPPIHQIQVIDLCQYIAIELESAVYAKIITSAEADNIMLRCTSMYRY